MENQPTPPTSPDIPTPDVPQTPTPPPPDQPGSTPAPLVNVRTIDSKEAAACEAQPGSIAPLNTRIIAALIDSAISGIPSAVLGHLSPVLGQLCWLLGFAYLLTRDSLPFLGGQSIGKKVMKLKAVTLDGQSLVNKWEPAVIRNLSLLISPVELYILFTREGKPNQGTRLGDEWAKTKVIVAEDQATAG